MPAKRATAPEGFSYPIVRAGDPWPTLEQHPDYAARAARLAELKSSLAGVTAELMRPSDDATKSKTDRARALIDGGDVAVLERPDNRARLLQAKADLTLAISVQENELMAARFRVSALIRDAIEDYHRELVRNLCTALIAAHAAHRAYAALADHLNDHNVAWANLYPMHPNFLGSPDGRGRVSAYLREAQKHGFLGSTRDVPTELLAD